MVGGRMEEADEACLTEEARAERSDVVSTLYEMLTRTCIRSEMLRELQRRSQVWVSEATQHAESTDRG